MIILHLILEIEQKNKLSINELVKLFPYATTIKFLSTNYTPNDTTYSGNFSIKTDICSNPIFSLNNGYETSWTIDYDTHLITEKSNINNWIGTSTAKERMDSTIPCNPQYPSTDPNKFVIFMGLV